MLRENDLPQEEGCPQPPPPYTEHTDVQVPHLSPSGEHDTRDATDTTFQPSTRPNQKSLWQWLNDVFGGTKDPTSPPRDEQLITRNTGTNNRRYYNIATSSSTIGTIPCPKAPEWRWKFQVDSLHYPPGYQSDDTFENAPWVAETSLAFDDPEVALRTLAQWRDNPDTCFRDTITVMGEPSTDRLLFVRNIQWQRYNSDDASNRFVEYNFDVFIYSKNSKWLANLPRASIGYGNFISLESAVRVDGMAFNGEDLLAPGQQFYLKFLKPWRMLFANERPPRSVSVVDLDLPEMRNIVDETLESRLRCPGDV